MRRDGTWSMEYDMGPGPGLVTQIFLLGILGYPSVNLFSVELGILY
jgi:hypothetical protein